jgi:hypothetical protein
VCGRLRAERPPTGEHCLALSFSLAPRREIPREQYAGQPASAQHLSEARTAYETARKLDPKNLRTRVALAFIYDRTRLRTQAAEELRFVIREGLARIPSRGSADWETHVVVREALEHFVIRSMSADDENLRAAIMNRLRGTTPSMSITPILVPIASNTRFEALVDRASDVSFDFSGQGVPVRGGWITDKAAWLVWDPHQRRNTSSSAAACPALTHPLAAEEPC